MTDGLSQVPGYGPFQEPPKDVEKKEKETKVSSPRQENPEADNIASTGEIEADAAKSDLEISKQMLDTTKAQLVELKAIREALAPKNPKELIKKGPKGTGTPSGNEKLLAKTYQSQNHSQNRTCHHLTMVGEMKLKPQRRFHILSN